MARFALDKQRRVIFAENAHRSLEYICIECETNVRLRSGPLRRPHFFHVDESRLCRHNGKTPEHIAVQHHLQRLIDEDHIALEEPFPEISRIADVCWRDERLIFEVQCSPIAIEELNARNRDYESLGFDVVWIFHEKRYSPKSFRAFEEAIYGRSHYFTNIDARGIGEIYDRYPRKSGIKRHLQVDLSQPIRTQHAHLSLTTLEERVKNRRVHFKGDCVTRAEEETPPFRKNKEMFFHHRIREYLSNVFRPIIRLHRAWIQHLIDRL
ncbi:MAG: hypothetical protein KDK40_00670 [Chlamydiia bacterium]|nr:hypothetical protein [Chlamydiia bacterium]